MMNDMIKFWQDMVVAKILFASKALNSQSSGHLGCVDWRMVLGHWANLRLSKFSVN